MMLNKHWCFFSTARNDRLLFQRIISEIDVSQKTVHYFRVKPQLCSIEDTSLIVSWGSGLDSSISTVANSLGIPVCYVENGYLPNTLNFDTDGVNYSSTLANMGHEAFLSMIQSMSIDKQKLEEMYHEPFVQLGPIAVPSDDCDDIKPLPKPYIFVPLQCRHDGNMTHYANGFTNESFVQFVVDNLPPGYSLVVKEHPGDMGRVDYTDFRASLPKDIPIQWRKMYRADFLLKHCTELWTINGSLVVEAMRTQKPVRVYGQSVFAPFANNGYDHNTVERFLYYLRWHYSIPINAAGEGNEGRRVAIKRLKEIADGNLAWLNVS